MATYLELVKKLARESGTLAESSVTSVISQTGRSNKLANWVADAWVNIQTDSDTWRWMRGSFTGNVLTSTPAYTGSSFTLTRFGSWAEDDEFGYRPFSLFDPAIGEEDEGQITQISYDEYREKYINNTHDENRPTEYAISPANELLLGPTPDQAYTLRGEYVKSPQVLASNSETPELPSQFHDVIVWEAMRLLHMADGAPQEMLIAIAERDRIKALLARHQQPHITIGAGPLA